MEKKKAMWRTPWAYRESLVVVAALVCGGFVIQLVSGPFDFYFLHRPVSYIVCALMVVLAALSLAAPNSRLVKWLAGVHLSVALIVFLLLLALIMGLTPQLSRLPEERDWLLRLGFAQVTSAWPFVLVYLATLLSLALVIARRLKAARRGRLVFLLNHLGLWLVLAAAGLGAADTRRYVMHVQEGQVEWRVYSADQQVLELPLAIRLDDFSMEEYPAKLAIIDRQTGQPLPQGRPELYQIDLENPRASLLDWDITVKDFLYEAVPAGGGVYQASNMPASAQAVQLIVQNRQSKVIHQGWVSSGNNFLPVSPLVLDDNLVLVMSQAEPKRFASQVKVFAQNGLEREAVIEVNKPLRVNGWLIYQYSYDNQAGRMSSYSSFELVYDPWIYPVYVGLLMWALGSLGLIWRGKPGMGEKS